MRVSKLREKYGRQFGGNASFQLEPSDKPRRRYEPASGRFAGWVVVRGILFGGLVGGRSVVFVLVPSAVFLLIRGSNVDIIDFRGHPAPANPRAQPERTDYDRWPGTAAAAAQSEPAAAATAGRGQRVQNGPLGGSFRRGRTGSEAKENR